MGLADVRDGVLGMVRVVDTTFSVLVGSVPHAVFNLAFLGAILPPLLGMRPELHGRPEQHRMGPASGSG